MIELIWKAGIVVGFYLSSFLLMKWVYLKLGGSKEELEEKFEK